MIKRLFDIVSASVGLILFAPVLLLIALAIKFEDKGTVFYRGIRVGRYGNPFKIFKFRTMVMNADVIGGPSTSDCDRRITRVGMILRKYKLDELPQLINVLKGEMSMVGPRPEVKKYTDLYNDEEKAILMIRPGITDWASIANSDEGAVLAKYDDPDKAYEEIIRPEKIRLQLKYVRERSFAKDLAIILQTLKAVVVR
jgi:lipopolysaccharide/colanic/teichoic acid biosynthesis glycosyltransferase